MRKLLPVRLAAAATAAGALALHAPAASATHEYTRCTLRAAQVNGVTGDGTYEGVAAGVAAAPGDTVAIRCVIWVNGQLRAATPLSPATPGVAATAGYVGFVAESTDSVALCAEVTTSHGTTEHCPWITPPLPYDVLEYVADEVDGLFYDSVDPALCPALADAAPGVPPVVVTGDGDVLVGGELVWDCPPYGT